MKTAYNPAPGILGEAPVVPVPFDVEELNRLDAEDLNRKEKQAKHVRRKKKKRRRK